jgi:Polysulphide reductase, NrfD
VNSDRALSYYGRPIIKEPVWTWEIPVYFFTGGIGGASAALSLAARIGGNEPLAKASLYIGALGDAVSPALLISDLGRPERFLNMFRVFKVTSPMSVGSWLLAASGGASSAAAVLEVLGRWRPAKYAAEAVSALLGGPLATYTGALVANTAVPVWHEARRELPYLFGASSLASAGAASALVLPPDQAGPARRLAIGGAAAGLATAQVMERRLGRLIAEPYRHGSSGKLARASQLCVASGAGLLAARGSQSRPLAAAGSALVLTGELLLRWSVFKAGFASARDPKYIVVPQRERAAGRAREAK